MGTPKENVADCIAKGRRSPAGSETHCINGHPYADKGKRPSGQCRACSNVIARDYKRRKRLEKAKLRRPDPS